MELPLSYVVVLICDIFRCVRCEIDVAALCCEYYITANSYARILGVYKNIMPTYSSYLRFF
jgi:hypothetical protein